MTGPRQPCRRIAGSLARGLAGRTYRPTRRSGSRFTAAKPCASLHAQAAPGLVDSGGAFNPNDRRGVLVTTADVFESDKRPTAAVPQRPLYGSSSSSVPKVT